MTRCNPLTAVAQQLGFRGAPPMPAQSSDKKNEKTGINREADRTMGTEVIMMNE